MWLYSWAHNLHMTDKTIAQVWLIDNCILGDIFTFTEVMSSERFTPAKWRLEVTRWSKTTSYLYSVVMFLSLRLKFSYMNHGEYFFQIWTFYESILELVSYTGQTDRQTDNEQRLMQSIMGHNAPDPVESQMTCGIMSRLKSADWSASWT